MLECECLCEQVDSNSLTGVWDLILQKFIGNSVFFLCSDYINDYILSSLYCHNIARYLSWFANHLIHRTHHDRESGDYAGSISDLQSVTSRLSTVSVSNCKFLFNLLSKCILKYW